MKKLLLAAIIFLFASCKKEVIEPKVKGYTLELKTDLFNPVVIVDYTISYTDINGKYFNKKQRATNVDFTKEIIITAKSGFYINSEDSTYWHPAESQYNLYKDNELIDSKKGWTYEWNSL